ncbi:hypothetical protein M408DRAFT_333891 [Serendipita vermifera MAFF 305830]|uniref:Uncharacterized protein n=1 Tax=Serendipita vermifera MAFF 305830 TaxID=933852 RepID=A0A0C3AMY3_SERVB|nr:hypothetical protein M408DRAFT_333891 [Serendipita vermifera MAFF 305830]
MAIRPLPLPQEIACPNFCATTQETSGLTPIEKRISKNELIRKGTRRGWLTCWNHVVKVCVSLSDLSYSHVGRVSGFA